MSALYGFRWRFAMVSVLALFVMSCSGKSEGPEIYDISPTHGAVGATVTIVGAGFDPTAANNTVMFNGTTALVPSATETEIVTAVPLGATSGKISISVNGQTATSTGNFTVLPSIDGFSPASGSVGATVIITGTGFDPTAANNTVMFNGTAAVVSSVMGTEIVTAVPSGATTGKVSVSVNGQSTNSSSDFTVN